MLILKGCGYEVMIIILNCGVQLNKRLWLAMSYGGHYIWARNCRGLPMGMRAEDIKTMIANAIPGATIELVDTGGDNEHYSVTVTSALFAGKTRIAQHRMVMDALGGGMGTTLHALAVTTKTTS